MKQKKNQKNNKKRTSKIILSGGKSKEKEIEKLIKKEEIQKTPTKKQAKIKSKDNNNSLNSKTTVQIIMQNLHNAQQQGLNLPASNEDDNPDQLLLLQQQHQQQLQQIYPQQFQMSPVGQINAQYLYEQQQQNLQQQNFNLHQQQNSYLQSIQNNNNNGIQNDQLSIQQNNTITTPSADNNSEKIIQSLQQQQLQQQNGTTTTINTTTTKQEQLDKEISNKEEDKRLAKQTRRTRHDPVNRDFYCGCGKSYLSYPALYTHLKQKHGGVHPEGTFQVQVQKNLQDLPVQLTPTQQEILYYQIQIKEVYEEIVAFMDTIKINSAQNEKPTANLGKQLIQEFPVSYFQSKEEYQSIFEILQKLQNHTEYISQQIDPQTNLKKCDLNRIFAYFLWYLKDFVNIKEGMPEICIFVCLYRMALNQMGWKQLDCENDPELSSREFCAENSGECALMIGNEFVIDYLPLYFENQSLQQQEINNRFKIIGNDNDKLKNMVYIIQFFSNWLYVNRYSNAKLNIQYDQESSVSHQEFNNSSLQQEF